MRLSLVVAMAENGVIGRDGDLPWRLPSELKYFRQLTMGHIVLMGRRTYESLPRVLDGRQMWVLSRREDFHPAHARRFASLQAACEAAGDRELMVIGGASLYAEALPLADRIWLTRVHAVVDGDTRFPDWNEDDWQATSIAEHPADERHAWAHSIWRLDRRRHGDAS